MTLKPKTIVLFILLILFGTILFYSNIFLNAFKFITTGVMPPAPRAGAHAMSLMIKIKEEKKIECVNGILFDVKLDGGNCP